jgi:hypothetical protein
MNKLLQECKDEVCSKYGALTFEDLLNHSTVKDVADQLAQLYAERYARKFGDYLESRGFLDTDWREEEDTLAEFNKTTPEAMKTASEKLLIVAKTIEAIRNGAQVEWPEGIEKEIREIAKQIGPLRYDLEGSVSKAQLIFAIEQAQKDAYNEAIRDATYSVENVARMSGPFHTTINVKDSILKLLK